MSIKYKARSFLVNAKVTSINKRLLKTTSISVVVLMLMLVVNVLPAGAILPSPAGIFAQVTTSTFVDIADSYVDSSNSSTNYGSLTTLRGDGSPVVNSYMRFSVQGLSGAVTRATLRVYANSGASSGYDIRGVSNNTWDEATITYANAPAVGSVLGSSGSVSAGTWTTIDVTPYITVNGTYNLALTVPGSTAISFASRESGANAPQLVVETGGGSTATPTTAPSATSTQVATATRTPTPLGATATKTPTPLAATATKTPTPLAVTATKTPTPLAATATKTSTPLATLSATPTQINSPTATAAAGNLITFIPSADSYVSASNASTNYGSLTTLRGDGSPTVNSYLRFNVQGLSGAVTRATLRVFANSVSNTGYDVRGVSNNTWGELTLTYSNAPAVGNILGSSGSFGGGIWTTVDVTPYITGNNTYSLALTVSTNQATSFASRESGVNAPQLIIQTASGGAATSTPTSLATNTRTPTPTSTRTPTPGPSPTPNTAAIKHVFVVVMENHSYNQVWSTSSSPYITGLGNSYVRATNYHAITHPSLPNYLDLYGGGNYGITTDCSPSTSCHVNATNLADNLEAKGLTWKGYMESMPSPCYLSGSGTYAPRHNPMIYFDDIRTNTTRCNSHDVPYTVLATDLASASTTPSYSLIVPNLCNDMHDCSVSTGDTWLKNNLPAILNSPACTVDKCLLILTWDEDDGSQGNQVLTIFAGSGAKTGGLTSSVSYTHFSMLRTIENIFGLPTQTSNDAAASPMTDMLR